MDKIISSFISNLIIKIMEQSRWALKIIYKNYKEPCLTNIIEKVYKQLKSNQRRILHLSTPHSYLILKMLTRFKITNRDVVA